MVSEEKIFENVDGQTDGRTTDAGVTVILIAHLGAFGSGELKCKGHYQIGNETQFANLLPTIFSHITMVSYPSLPQAFS